MKVLVIEDEILIQKSLKRFLEKRDVSVDTSSTGRDAIEMILNNDYDRIVCDLMLKDITGFDVIEESKKRYSLTEIGNLFIIITAYCSEQVLNTAAQYNCPVLTKPFENLNSAIDSILGNSNAPEEERN